MKTKKISWQAIAIVVLALVLIASIALGVSGAWFQDKDSVSQEVTMGTPVTIRLQKADTTTGENVETWGKIYKTSSEVYPGDKIMGATEIATGTATPSVLRMKLVTSVKAGATDTDGATYNGITAMDSTTAATFDPMTDKPLRSNYASDSEYNTAMGTYATNVNKYNKYLIETMLAKTMANVSTWTQSTDKTYYYYNEIVKAATDIKVFDSLDLSTSLTNECSGWIISVSVEVEAIQAANLSSNTAWYSADSTGSTMPSGLKDKVDTYNSNDGTNGRLN